MASKINIDRIRDLAHASLPDVDALGNSLGDREDCFSARRFNELIMDGADYAETDHLGDCMICVDNLVAQGSVGLPHDVLQPEPRSRTQIKDLLRPARRDASRVSTGILSAPQRTQKIDLGSRPEKMQFRVHPAFDRARLADIDPDSIEVSGAVRGKATFKPVDFDSDGVLDYGEIDLSNVDLDRRVISGLENDQRVLDRVHVKGIFDGDREDELSLWMTMAFDPKKDE